MTLIGVLWLWLALNGLCSTQSSCPHAPEQQVTRHLPLICCALRGQNRPRQLRRSQAVNGEGSSWLSALIGFEVVSVTREDLRSSLQAAIEALGWVMPLGEVKGECGRSLQEDTSKVA